MGPTRRRRGLFPRHDRLHLHGEGHELHVRHRPGRGEDRHLRDRDRTKSSAAPRPTPRSRSVADAAFDNDIEALLEVRRLFDFLPLNANDKAPRASPSTTHRRAASDALDTIIPDSANKPYDMREVILQTGRRRRFPRAAEGPRRQHPHRLHPAQRRHRRRRRQPAAGAGRLPRHQLVARRPRASSASATASTSQS